ncbi:hypothetical protein D3C87_1542150 [compost metagenome]
MSKPDWKKAPEWAGWLAQDNDGWWFWWCDKPVVTGDYEDFWMPSNPNPDAKFDRAGKRGPTPIDWTTTLEPRP